MPISAMPLSSCETVGKVSANFLFSMQHFTNVHVILNVGVMLLFSIIPILVYVLPIFSSVQQG